MPIAHGEGRVTFDSPESRDRAIAAGAAVMRYTSCELNASHNPCGRDEPYNPNGSEADIAGMCDETGRVLGLMPHPERFVTWTQHPCWTSRLRREEGDGLGLFRRGAAFLS
jgi:phosphoribosylformylglycinamidine synthase